MFERFQLADYLAALRTERALSDWEREFCASLAARLNDGTQTTASRKQWRVIDSMLVKVGDMTPERFNQLHGCQL